MADTVAPIVVENLIKLLTYEANLLREAEDKVISIRQNLEFMNAFLRKSAGKRNDELVKVLVDQIRDVALDSEGVVDTYMERAIKQRRRNLLCKLFHCIGYASVLHGVANQTSSIKQRIDDIYKNKARYHIDEDDQPSVDDEEAEQSLERRRRNVEEYDVVGFDSDTITLIKQLTNQSNLTRDVISIHGMGGLGKTTLARKIYKDTRIKDHFNFCAWVSVSQQWQAKSLLLDLLKSFKQITEEISEKTVEDLKDGLHERLKGKRYFIVMDDIWSTDVWDEVKVAFPDDSNGSRLLITTRVGEVASHASPTSPYELKTLDDDKSWELLQKKVFRGREWQSLPNLVEPGKELAKSCRGLPLSIVLLGGILAKKEKSYRVWFRFVGNVKSHLGEGVSILTLSYNHLPQELKPCFLYVGLFPEDSEIKAKELIELWIAEGFIQSARNTSIYDVAEEYLEKLVDRSMIQVASKRLDGGVKTCRIHDLLRDLCIAESRRDKFFEIYSIDNNVQLNSKSRRFSVQHHSSAKSLNSDQSSCARSLLYFCVGHSSLSKSDWKQIGSTKFIRVLCLFNLVIKKIPSQIHKLIFLRCLFIKKCRIYYISSSMWNFQHLETLHLHYHGPELLPKDVWSVMKNLRYLYMNDYGQFYFSKPPRSLLGEPFSNLQVLCWLHLNHNTAIVIAKFPNLRKLGLIFKHDIEEGEVEKAMASIQRLKSLQSFKFNCRFGNYNTVVTRLNMLPSTLTKISWRTDGTCDRDIFKGLARQPHLRVLKITSVGINQPRELSVVAGDFPQLQVLKLTMLPIKTFEMEKDAIPNLQSLFINHCLNLEYLPEDELLRRGNLQLVDVRGSDADLRAMLRHFKIKYPDTPCKINFI